MRPFEDIPLVDGKILVGVFATAATVGGSWIDLANAYGELALSVVGLLVGVATLWYTVERARSIRQERKDKKDRKD